MSYPGSYVIYRGVRSGEEHWPAVMFLDEDAPQEIQQDRPPGYVTLVLLYGEPARTFRWATTLQLSPLTTLDNACSPEHSEDVRQAFRQAIFMREEVQAGLEYWKNEVAKQFGTLPNYSENVDEAVTGTDEEIDEQVSEAIRTSKEEYDRSSSLAIRTPTHPPKRRRTARCREDSSISPTTLSDDEDSPPKRRRHSSATDHETLGLPPQRIEQSSKYQGRSALECMRSFNQSSATPTSDTVDDDLEQSKAFIHIPVGPDQVIHTFQKKDVWDRPYFRNAGAAINYFAMDDEGTWVLRHPKLTSISSEDFRFVSDYLTRDDFGIHYPENPEQNQEAICQCVAAWDVADKLGAADMQDYIAKKVQYIEWELADVLTFAIVIYRSGPSLLDDDPIRDWVSGYIAQHYFAYLKDETISTAFRKNIRKLRALWKDVLVKLLQIEERGDEMEEEQESDEDNLIDDDDL